MIEALCFSSHPRCGTYDWGTTDDPPAELCPTCQTPRAIIADGVLVSGDLRRAGGNRKQARGKRGQDTKIRASYVRDAGTV